MLPHTEGSNGKPRIKLPEPAFSDENIWQGDLFGRAKYAATIRDMLADETEPLVVAVNGKWGSGKSFFLQRFAREYERQQTSGFCIYLNAWESDYLANPLLFLYSGIARALRARSQFDSVDPLALKEAVKIAEQIGWNIARVFTGGIVDNLKSSDDSHPCSIYDRLVEVTEGAKKYLGAIAEKVREQTRKPLIVCMDELDRCRPTYAIEMLERIKHLFNVPSIVFLLGLDREQLCQSIVTVYGNIDRENYLHRFFDLEFVLPEPNRAIFIDAKLKEYGITNYWRQLDATKNSTLCFEEGALFRQAFQLLAFAHRLELREIQTVLKWFAVLARSQKAGVFMCPFFFVVLVILRLRKRNLYEKFVRGIATPAEVLDFLLPQEMLSELESRDVYCCDGVVIAVYCSMTRNGGENPFLKQLQDLVQQDEEEATWPEALPQIIRNYQRENIQILLEKIRRTELEYNYFYNYKAREMLVCRLETFA